MNIGVSPITNKIYIGNIRKLKSGMTVWTKKTEFTDESIKAVFEYMYNKSEETGECTLTIEGFGVMSFKRVSDN